MKYAPPLFLLLLASCFNAQENVDQKCWNGSCRAGKLIDKQYFYALSDEAGELLSEFKYKHLSFTESFGVLSFKENDKYGLMNAKGKILIEPKYRHIIKSQKNLVIVTDTNKKKSLLNLNGDTLIHDKFKFFSIFDFVWTRKDSTSQLYDHGGNLVSQTVYKSYSMFLALANGDHDSAWMTHSISDELEIIKIKDGKVSIEKYLDVYQPSDKSSVVIFTLPANSEGNVLKKYTFEFGKTESDPIYLEICTNPECLEPYKDKIPYDKIRKMNASLIGILEDYSVHLINYKGKTTLVKN